MKSPSQFFSYFFTSKTLQKGLSNLNPQNCYGRAEYNKMINRLIGGFVAIIIGVSLIGPIASQVNIVATSANSTGSTCTSTSQAGCANAGLYLSSSWGATVLKMVPGFFALGILGIGIAVTYGALRDAGVV